VVRFASHDEKGLHFVIPANAGIHGAVWIPAYAGMTPWTISEFQDFQSATRGSYLRRSDAAILAAAATAK